MNNINKQETFQDYFAGALAEVFHKAIDEQIRLAQESFRDRLTELAAKAAIRIAKQASVTEYKDKIIIELRFKGD